MASFLRVRPNYSFHVVSMERRRSRAGMRDVMGSDIWINGGYFVLRREIFDHCGRARSWSRSRSSG